ncbi:MAG TPA: hypothetical protein VFE33_34585 [Thermoanaerobaculia bacterium]|nr:hypothetical protein [Thermoanaerobaculia bacterium]
MRNRHLAILGLSCLGVVLILALSATAAAAAGGRVLTDVRKGTYRGDAAPFDPLAPLVPLAPPAPAVGNGIDYNGGPVMHGTVHVYYIWYGNWSSNTGPTVLQDWARHIGGSPYFNINTTYTDSTNAAVSNSVTFGGAVNDAYSQGTSLSDAKILTIVSSAINSSALPLDAQGVYFVLTSADVAETSGFCSIYCGWHTYDTISGVNVKYAFVGNSDRCPSACQGIPGNQPNGNSGADGMASIMAHELDETVTDPLLNAWFDASGNENGDKCSYNYGVTYTTANGAKANLRLGSRDYLLQRNWINAGGGSCQVGFNPGLAFYSITPCRLIDTRNPQGPAGGPALQAGATRTFALAGQCGIPASARSLSVNLTVTQPAAAGYLSLFPADQSIPVASVINFSAGQIRSNNATLPLSGEGSGSLAVTDSSAGTVHFILDVNGYYQ